MAENEKAGFWAIIEIMEAARISAGRLTEQPMSEWELPDEWRQAIRQGRLSFDPEVDPDAHYATDPDDEF